MPPAHTPHQEKSWAARQALLGLFEGIKDQLGDISTDELTVLMHIAMTPGEPQSAYVTKTSLPRSSVQRYIHLLSSKGFRTRQGLGLIEDRPSDTDWREKCYHLTAKGRAVVQDMQRSLDRYCTRTKEST